MGWEEPAVLVTSELVTNAVRHAGTELTVRIVKGASQITIEVADEAADREPRVGTSDAHIPGGVGLMIVGQLAEEWGVEKRRDGKSVWARLALDRPDDQP
jgi:anti-sigma regulatory factor (Ser/Thr protein kinase)